MTTSQTEFLSNILDSNAIPEGSFVYFRGDLENQAHSLLLRTYQKRHLEQGLSQKEYAARIHHSAEVVNRHIAAAGNWRLGTMADYFLGLHARVVISVILLEDLQSSASAASEQKQASRPDVIRRFDAGRFVGSSNNAPLPATIKQQSASGATPRIRLTNLAAGGSNPRPVRLIRPPNRTPAIVGDVMEQRPYKSEGLMEKIGVN